jgi:spore maturation protein CgeB
MGIPIELCDRREAYRGGLVRRRILWWLAGRRPARLAPFSRAVAEAARRWQPDVVITTGIAPVDRETLGVLSRRGIRLVNFLTDDPWNRAHFAPWFLAALPLYDHVWSPRSENIDDLRRAGARQVDYLPFAYNATVHYAETLDTEADRARYDADVLLVGGADADRVPMVAPMVRAGMNVALYGGYWHRYRSTRPYAKGWLDAEGGRKATAGARVCLGLVRRANRDGHSMRTFEVPAMRGCLLAERTADHQRLFGPENEAVLYFTTPEEVVDRVRWLLERPGERVRLAAAAHARITAGGHTYRDRLATMLGTEAA